VYGKSLLTVMQKVATVDFGSYVENEDSGRLSLS